MKTGKDGLTFELIRFAAVGLASMTIHFLAVAVLVPSGMHPLGANGMGFFIAFQASFLGHSRWTFRARRRFRQYRRLFLVSVTGFILNELCYALLLATCLLDYRAALAMVLVGIAGGTYLASKIWVFTHPKKAP